MKRSITSRRTSGAVAAGSFHEQSAPKHGARAGETFEFTDQLRHGKTVVGHDIGTGTYAGPNHFEVDWTLRLKGGSIQMAGVGEPTNKAYHLAVIGGTGKYAGASGTFTITDANKSVAHYTVVLD